MSCENDGRRGLRIRGVRQINSQGGPAQPLRDRFETGMELKGESLSTIDTPGAAGEINGC